MDDLGYSKPLVAYLPALLGGLSTENILAGAGGAANLGLILLIAIAAVPYRGRIADAGRSLFVRPEPGHFRHGAHAGSANS